jgi:hypothetical protein
MLSKLPMKNKTQRLGVIYAFFMQISVVREIARPSQSTIQVNFLGSLNEKGNFT